MKRTRVLTLLAALSPLIPAPAATADSTATSSAYCRFPAIHEDDIVFTAEGDLWEVGLRGGAARRLTSHPGEESHAAFSPNGKLLAFSAQYEGPQEVYIMPVAGGRPRRLTFEGGSSFVAGWTPDGKVLYLDQVFLDPARLAARHRRSPERRDRTLAAQPGQRRRVRPDGQDPLFHASALPRQQHQALSRRHRPEPLEIHALERGSCPPRPRLRRAPANARCGGKTASISFAIAMAP